VAVFDGVRGVELAGLAPAPFAATMLADHGADVVRVIRPDQRDGSSPLIRGRKTIAHDLKTVEGREAVIELARGADVFLEGFRPGVAERLGLGPEVLMTQNPRLIYGRVTGWGQSGPLAHSAGHDINYLAVSGVLGALGPRGAKPHAPLNLLGDFAGGGLLMAFGIAAALYERERSGLGQVIDAAMVDGVALLMASLCGRIAAGTESPEAGSNLIDGGAPFYNTYPTADDRYVAVGALEPRFYAILMNRLGLDSAQTPEQYDQASWPELSKLMASAFRRKTLRVWESVFAGCDACFAPVLTPGEAVTHPQLAARGTFVTDGAAFQPAAASRFSRLPPLTGSER
jgi:alpha-methylacyl-CoA racemase